MIDSALFVQNLWASSLALIPLALGVGIICRTFVKRPATRHALWLIVLLTLLLPSAAALLGLERLPDPIGNLSQWMQERATLEKRAPLSSAIHPHTASTAHGPDTARSGGSVAAGSPEASQRVLPRWLGRTLPGDYPEAHSEGIAFHRDTSTPLSHLLRSPSPPRIESDPAAGSLARRIPRAGPMHRHPMVPEIESAERSALMAAGAHPLAARLEIRPVEAARPPSETIASMAMGAARQWWNASATWARGAAGRVREARDSIASLPPLPMEAWFGGVLLILILWLTRGATRRSIFASARPAPAPIQQMVSDASRLVGVDPAPRAFVVDARVSPMVIAIGIRPKLILPRGLWSELSEDARRAVLIHEIAHLRRRDHWVCWMQWIIGLIYWWHPVVWWVRRRLREEADLSCDAWVMSLLPSCRRTYAEALLRANDYIGSGRTMSPVLALQMTSPRARRFARRLTMVMTQRLGPKASPLGLLLAAAVATGGMLMTPALACNDKDKDKDKSTSKLVVTPPAPAPVVRVAPAPPVPSVVALGAHPRHDEAESKGQSTFERHMDQRRSKEEEERIRELEQRLRGLETELQERVQRRLRETREPREPRAPRADGPQARAPEGDTFALVYSLPDGKLAALTQLMVRSDVPILVRPGSGSLTVWATRPQHRVFRAFSELISPGDVTVTTPEGDEVGGRALAPGAREARRRAEDNKRRDAMRQHERTMRNQERQHRRHLERQHREHERRLHEHQRHLEHMHRQLERRHRSHDDDDCSPSRSGQIRHFHSRIEALSADADARRSAADSLRAQMEQLQDMALSMQSEASSHADRAVAAMDAELAESLAGLEAERETLLAEAEIIRERANALVERATEEAIQDVEREAMIEMAEEMEAQAELVEQKVETIETQAEVVEAQAEAVSESLESQAEAYEDQSEAYEDVIEELEEQIEELLEQAEDLDEQARELESEAAEMEQQRNEDEDADEEADVVASAAS